LYVDLAKNAEAFVFEAGFEPRHRVFEREMDWTAAPAIGAVIADYMNCYNSCE
jgi:hypothetical protein